MTLRYPALLDDDIPATLAPALAALLKEADAPVRDAVEAALRTLASHASQIAASPFGAAELLRAVSDSPFDASRPLLAVDADGVALLLGRPVVEGAPWALRVFGVERTVRLASALARVLPLGTVSAARIPAVCAPVLLAGIAEVVREEGLDAVGLSVLLARAAPMRTASLLALRIGTAAGLPLAPVPLGGA